MATNSESMLSDEQSPGNLPVTSGPLLRSLTDGAPDPRLGERIEYLKKAVESMLKDTKWPSESKNAANDLLNTVKSSPKIPINTTSSIQDIVKEYIKILEEVEARLKDAKSKSGVKRWKLLEGIRSMASNRPSKCTLLFQTCQDDVSKVVVSIKEFLDNERERKNHMASGIHLGSLTVARAGPAPAPLSAAQKKPSDQTIASNNATSGALPTPKSPLRHPEDEESRSPIRQEALTAYRKTFKAVEVVSGSIPVAGNFIAAAAKVGLAFVETVQTMDKNHDLAKDLTFQTDRLSKCLATFTKVPNSNQEQEIADHIEDVQNELQRVHDKVQEWRSLGRFNKAFHARDHGEALNGHQGTIQTVMEEMQLLVGLDTRNIVMELKSSETQKERRRLLKCLGDGKYGAQGNSVQDVTCYPGTRVEILERIDSWIRDSSAPDRVLWLRGMAGRGKSTIASTVVENWKHRASCAIFHFRRGQNTLNTRVVCALARQLATSLVQEVKNAVLDSVRENEDIADKRLEEQFKALFVSPLAKLHNQLHPILIVVDALDENDNPKDAVDFIRLIDSHSALFPANIKFLLTSRPEAQLLQAFDHRKWLSEDLDMASDVSSDLERFIQQACQQIRETNSNVPNSWPSSDDVNRLVEMSQGLFQWARTAITYMSSGSPVDRLRTLLRRPSMWSGLDDLYHQILSKAFDALRLDADRENLLQRVLGTFVAAPHPISLEIIAGLYGDNEIFEGIVQADIILFLRNDILADLNSLLFIPTSSTEPIRLMHTSIHDLLVSERRCKQACYYIDVIRHHQHLANMCLTMMLRDLKENIGNLSDLSKPASEVQDIAEHRVTKALLYSCRSWSIHLTEGVRWPAKERNATSVELADFETFSKEKIMCWLEVMSLAGATNDAITMAKQVCEWLEPCPKSVLESDFLATLWNDVRRFITMFSEPIEFGPLHIYMSALPHCPAETELGRLYRKLAKVRTIHGHQASTWPSDIWVRSLNEMVRTVVFSPDGKVIASGSRGNTARFWDTQTGTVIGEPLTGHSKHVKSVCFSPDIMVLASGSDDNTIQLWDPQTGAVIGEPLTGHSGSVTSISFSPDAKVLASGSLDKTVRLWDAQTGSAIGEPLTDHNGWVHSICFSPDGKVLASGSADETIRLWDTQTGTAIGEPLTDHNGWVHSVCFSPDGRVLASGSGNKTIRLWNIQTGTAIGEPLKGHREWVQSLCFSPDGRVLASGSDDKTIRLWNTQSGTAIGEPLKGHSSAVTSVCFSPDGKVLASGSWDDTIRLWDIRIGTVTGEPPTGHSDSVESACSSPNDKVPASGFWDDTIQLRDIETGTVTGESLTGHSDSAESVRFLDDGGVLASAPWDETIGLWDTQPGTMFGESLTDHNNSVESFYFFTDDGILVSGSNAIQLWYTQNGAVSSESLTDDGDWVGSVCFSPDGKVLASGSADWTIRLWNTRTGTLIGKPIKGLSRLATSVCFSPDGKVLVSGSDDNIIRLWDPQTGTLISEPLTGHTGCVRSVCFSPDGKVLASGSADKTIRLWDTQTGAIIGKPLAGHEDSVWSVCFSPDAKVLASGSDDQTIRLWDMQTGTAIGKPLAGHKDSVRSVCFSPQGLLLRGRCSNGSCATWDAVRHQRCETPHSLPLRWNPAFQDNWVVFSSSRFMWLPPQYWDIDSSPEIFLSGNTLAVLHSGNLSFFDVSQALELC